MRKTPLTWKVQFTRWHAAAVLPALVALGARGALAQSSAPGTTTYSVAVVTFAQAGTSFGQQGTQSWKAIAGLASVSHQFDSAFSTGLSLRWDQQDWAFRYAPTPAPPPFARPWGVVNFPQLSVPLTFTPRPWLFFLVSPQIGLARAPEAPQSTSLVYGGVASAAMAFSRRFVIGVGVGMFYQVYQTRVYPFPVIYWRLSDAWTVRNPFVAGPAGGAGVEVIYAPAPKLEAAFGGSYRTYVFRVAPNAFAPNGIGENSFWPFWLRGSWSFAPHYRADLYLATVQSGALTQRDSSGAQLLKYRYAPAPAFAFTLQATY